MKQEQENPNWWSQKLKIFYIAKRKSKDRTFKGLRGRSNEDEFWNEISEKIRPFNITPERAVELLFNFSDSDCPSPFDLMDIIDGGLFAGSVRAEQLDLKEMKMLNLDRYDWEDRRHFELLESILYYKNIVANAAGRESPGNSKFNEFLVYECLGVPAWVALTLAHEDPAVVSVVREKAQLHFQDDPSAASIAIRLGCPVALVHPEGDP